MARWPWSISIPQSLNYKPMSLVEQYFKLYIHQGIDHDRTDKYPHLLDQTAE